jgi:c-di-GMP-binding flagellar brake protein YcgR
MPELQIGEKIMLEISLPGHESARLVKSLVMEMDDKGYYLAVPMIDGKKYRMDPGEQMNVMFFRDSGQYSFRAEHVQTQMTGMAPVCRVVRVSAFKKLQRRSSFRLSCMLKAVIKSVISGISSRAVIQDVEAIVCDISGTGVKAFAHKSFQPGESIECTLYLNPDTITLSAKILRCIKQPDGRNHELGIHFENITENEQDRIMAFIFRRQRELSQKGLK